jgi:hypothetical protein
MILKMKKGNSNEEKMIKVIMIPSWSEGGVLELLELLFSKLEHAARTIIEITSPIMHIPNRKLFLCTLFLIFCIPEHFLIILH